MPPFLLAVLPLAPAPSGVSVRTACLLVGGG